MIITTSWLSEYIDISSLTPEDICDKLNKIGLEVASLEKHQLDKNIVVGEVLSCEKHPDADKLSVCQVDTGSATLQIVCGAKNVREGLFVPVSKVGATLPEGLKIRDAELRGVKSSGMICSAKELNLPDINDGIMELDESIGKLEKGKPLNDYPLVCDDVIEIELTANRGDCLSINGVSRDLKAAFNLGNVFNDKKIDDTTSRGIARVLNTISENSVTSHNMYRLVEHFTIKTCLKINLRLGFIGQQKETNLEKLLCYSTHCTGVILNAYHAGEMEESKEKTTIELTNENGVNVMSFGRRKRSEIGIKNLVEDSYLDSGKSLIFEASYVDPNSVSEIVYEQKLKTDDTFYRSSRGSEPELKIGLDTLFRELENSSSVTFFSETIQNSISFKPKLIHINLDSVNAKIGQMLPKSDAVKILKDLGFSVQVQADQNNLIVEVPTFRHDIVNEADTIEEFVRIIGIDNIASKPIVMAEMRNADDSYKSYKLERVLAGKASAAGFSESLHFVFSDQKKLKEYGFDIIEEKNELLNPITADFNTLRTSLLPNLLDGVKLNINKSKSKVGLFEVGDIFNGKREQSRSFGLIYCGDAQEESVTNHGKPAKIDFGSFVSKIASIIGDFELEKNSQPVAFFHPGQCGTIMQNGKEIGILGKVHPKILKGHSLDTAFACQIELKIENFRDCQATPHSVYQPVKRDLSLLIGKNVSFADVKKEILALNIQELQRVYPADIYEDESLGDKISLTIKMVLQSNESTMSEDQINGAVDKVLETLKEKFGAELR